MCCRYTLGFLCPLDEGGTRLAGLEWDGYAAIHTCCHYYTICRRYIGSGAVVALNWACGATCSAWYDIFVILLSITRLVVAICHLPMIFQIFTYQ